MKAKTKQITAAELDKLVDQGKKEVLQYFDFTKAVRSGATAPQHVNVDFPAWVVERLDLESNRLGITRQSLIKVWVTERLEKASS